MNETTVKEQFKTDWLPTIAWVRQGNGWRAGLAFAPSMVTTGSDVFTMELRFFEKGESKGVTHSTSVTYPGTLRIDVGEELKKLGISQFDGLAEVVVRGEGPWSAQKRVKCIMDVWMEISSDDGKFRVVGPTGQFAGSNRVRVQSDLSYESYPGVPVSGDFTTDILLLNPYTIPVWYQIAAIMPDGKKIVSDKKSLLKRSTTLVPLKSVLPTLGPSGASTVSLLVISKFKLIAYCLFRNEKTGETTALDHTWPFLEFRREL